MALRDMINRLALYLGRKNTPTESDGVAFDADTWSRYKRIAQNLDDMGSENLLSSEALHAAFRYALRSSADAGERFVESLQIVEQAAAREKAGEPEPIDLASKAREDDAFQFLAQMVVRARAEQ
jgi:hypothetical protein